jgi:hypothetical protein
VPLVQCKTDYKGKPTSWGHTNGWMSRDMAADQFLGEFCASQQCRTRCSRHPSTRQGVHSARAAQSLPLFRGGSQWMMHCNMPRQGLRKVMTSRRRKFMCHNAQENVYRTLLWFIGLKWFGMQCPLGRISAESAGERLLLFWRGLNFRSIPSFRCCADPSYETQMPVHFLSGSSRVVFVRLDRS